MFHMFSRVFGNSFSWLGEYSRPLLVSGSNVTILSTPGEYLQWLKVCRIFKFFILFLFYYRVRLILLSWGSASPLFILGLESSKRNWYIFVLYDSLPFIPLSLFQVLLIGSSLRNKPSLQCSIILDCLRGHRGNPNSLSVLGTLIRDFPRRFSLYMYHTPSLRGLLKWGLPGRINEVVGLQHTKIHVFDDDVLLTG